MKTYPMAFIPAPHQIEFREMPLRDPEAGEVMIRVRAAAICGSDLHLFKGRHPSAALPAAVGHELSGDVVRLGAGVSRFAEGDRVTVEPAITCGTCEYCRRGQYHLCANISFQYRKGQGAFAKYFYAPENRVYRLPETLSYEQGALVEPLSVALHAVKKSGLRLGNSVAIFGAGAIGLLACALARLQASGQVFVVDVNDFRLQKAVELGATCAINNRAGDALEIIRRETGGLGADQAIEAVGLELTLTQALQSVRKGGLVTLLGIFEDSEPRLPVNLFIQREISLAGSQGYAWDFEDAIALAAGGRVDPGVLVTHRFALEDLQQGFELLLMPGSQALKVTASPIE